MSQHGYSLGRNHIVIVVLPEGSTLNFGQVTKWTAKQDSSEQKIVSMNGEIDHLRFYQGWSGSFEAERRGPDLDEYFAHLEANFHSGIDEPPATMQQTIVEPNGRVSQYRFERVLLKYDDAGDWSGDKAVHQKVSFVAARRIQQA